MPLDWCLQPEQLSLLAANSRPYPVDATFHIAGLTGRKLPRLFSKETYKVKDGGFNDSLAPYDTRAYVISDQKSEVRSQQSEISNQKSAIINYFRMFSISEYTFLFAPTVASSCPP